jgi:hypothetical protein
VTGKEEPEIVARFQKFLFEPNAQKAAQSTAARHRTHRLAKIGRDRRGVLGKEIDFVEACLFFKKIAQCFCIAFSILQRLQIVVSIDADTDCPVLAHLSRSTLSACAGLASLLTLFGAKTTIRGRDAQVDRG